jgi:hypothetical protein
MISFTQVNLETEKDLARNAGATTEDRLTCSSR